MVKHATCVGYGIYLVMPPRHIHCRGVHGVCARVHLRVASPLEHLGGAARSWGAGHQVGTEGLEPAHVGPEPGFGSPESLQQLSQLCDAGARPPARYL